MKMARSGLLPPSDFKPSSQSNARTLAWRTIMYCRCRRRNDLAIYSLKDDWIRWKSTAPNSIGPKSRLLLHCSGEVALQTEYSEYVLYLFPGTPVPLTDWTKQCPYKSTLSGLPATRLIHHDVMSPQSYTHLVYRIQEQ